MALHNRQSSWGLKPPVSSWVARAGVEPPQGVTWSDAIANRNWLIHQYDTVSQLPTRRASRPNWSVSEGPDK